MLPRERESWRRKWPNPPLLMQIKKHLLRFLWTRCRFADNKRYEEREKGYSPPVLPTPLSSGIHNAQHGSFQFSPSHPSPIVVTFSKPLGFHHMVLPFSWPSIVATKISSWTWSPKYETISKFIHKVNLHYIIFHFIT